MSLVAYDHSEESEEEVSSDELKTELSSNIPSSVVKKQRECVKITIPSLKEFEDEECPVLPKKPKLQSGSGLFSLLPPPKNTSISSKPGFVPYVLSKKPPAVSSASPKCEVKAIKIAMPEESTQEIFEKQDNEDGTSNIINKFSDNIHVSPSQDFFSLNEISSKSKVDDEDYLVDTVVKSDSSLLTVQNNILDSSSFEVLPSTSGAVIQPSHENTYAQQYLLSSSEVSSNGQEHLVDQNSDSYMNYIEPAVGFSSENSFLNDKEFLKFQGRRREFEAANIIDVNADDQLTDRNEWLMKSLTEESSHRPSRKKHNMPTQQQKRKHQITYLAFQAKEREMDLKNQWALNSRTRRETQAKYGF